MSGFKTLMAVSDIMNKHVVSISEKETIRNCAERVEKDDTSSLLVIDTSGDLKGIVTEHDIVRRAVAKGMDVDKETVSSIMTPDPLKIKHDESIFEARNMMKNNDVHHLIVMKENKPIGILTADNVLG